MDAAYKLMSLQRGDETVKFMRATCKSIVKKMVVKMGEKWGKIE